MDKNGYDLTIYTETELTLMYISKARCMSRDIANNTDPKMEKLLAHIEDNVLDFLYRMNRPMKPSWYLVKDEHGNWVRRSTRAAAAVLNRIRGCCG